MSGNLPAAHAAAVSPPPGGPLTAQRSDTLRTPLPRRPPPACPPPETLPPARRLPAPQAHCPGLRAAADSRVRARGPGAEDNGRVQGQRHNPLEKLPPKAFFPGRVGPQKRGFAGTSG